MRIGKSCGILYSITKLLKALRDVSVVFSSGRPKKIAKRAGRRIAGKAAGKTLRKLFK